MKLYTQNLMTEYIYTCTDIKHYTHDISMLSLYPAMEKITYQAGQYVELVLADKTTLPMSIANKPDAKGRLEFHLRYDEKHPNAQHVMANLATHMQVKLRGPFGNATLSRSNEAKHRLFLAGGTGFAPIKALLEEALYEQQQNDSIYLYWGIRKPQDGYQEKLLGQWQQEFPHFRYILVLSEPVSFPHWQGPTGLVHEFLAKEHPCLRNYCIYASGPYEMIKAAQHHFMHHGLTANQLISDML